MPYYVTTPTYNYYTYNYSSNNGSDGIVYADENTFADVRDRLAQQAEEPDAQTLADTYFENAVKAFENQEYQIAADWFEKAIDLATEDLILPFAYSQALIAAQNYSDAAEVLKIALEKIEPEKEAIFYPRGLYKDDETLYKQLEPLAQLAEDYPFRYELQLLLGFQMFGIGELDAAEQYINAAAQMPEYKDATVAMLKVLKKVRTENTQQQKQ